MQTNLGVQAACVLRCMQNVLGSRPPAAAMYANKLGCTGSLCVALSNTTQSCSKQRSLLMRCMQNLIGRRRPAAAMYANKLRCVGCLKRAHTIVYAPKYHMCSKTDVLSSLTLGFDHQTASRLSLKWLKRLSRGEDICWLKSSRGLGYETFGDKRHLLAPSTPHE